MGPPGSAWSPLTSHAVFCLGPHHRAKSLPEQLLAPAPGPGDPVPLTSHATQVSIHWGQRAAPQAGGGGLPQELTLTQWCQAGTLWKWRAAPGAM